MKKYENLAGMEFEVVDNFVGLDDSEREVVFEISIADNGTPICYRCRNIDDGSTFDPGDLIDMSLFNSFLSAKEKKIKMEKHEGFEALKTKLENGNYGIYCEIGNLIYNLSEICTDKGKFYYILSEHAQAMPAYKEKAFKSIDEAIQAALEIAPAYKWNVAEE